MTGHALRVYKRTTKTRTTSTGRKDDYGLELAAPLTRPPRARTSWERLSSVPPGWFVDMTRGREPFERGRVPLRREVEFAIDETVELRGRAVVGLLQVFVSRSSIEKDPRGYSQWCSCDRDRYRHGRGSDVDVGARRRGRSVLGSRGRRFGSDVHRSSRRRRWCRRRITSPRRPTHVEDADTRVGKVVE
jgi:hypothetical protein